jgi:hypothetical protein
MSNKTQPSPSNDDFVKSANSGTKNTISRKIRKQPKTKRASISAALTLGARAAAERPF